MVAGAMEQTASNGYQHAPAAYTIPVTTNEKQLLVLDDWTEQRTRIAGWSTILPNHSHVATITRKARPLLSSLLPKFLRSGGLENRNLSNNPTAYLNGVRGLSALIVLNAHHYWRAPILKWPFFSVVEAGELMVLNFFVLSGVVLSKRMLSLSRRRNEGAHMDSELLQTFSTSILRRYLRLYIPAALASFVAVVWIWLGIFKGSNSDPIPIQLKNWLGYVIKSSNPFLDVKGYWVSGGTMTKYNDVLWTIPVEFRSSVVIYLFCLVTYKMTPAKRRLLCCATIVVFYFMWSVTYAALGLCGLLIAEDMVEKEAATARPIIPTQKEIPSDDLSLRSRLPKLSGLQRMLFYGTILAFALWAGSGNKKSPWHAEWLEQLIPTWWSARDQHFYPGLCAPLVIWCIHKCEPFQRPFTWPIAQYLGEVSFGIYVLHQLMLNSIPRATFGDWLQDTLGKSYATSAIQYCTFIFVAIWLADLYTRVDAKFVQLGQWVEKQIRTL